MKVKVSEASGAALDWMVAKADDRKILSSLCGEIRVADRKDGLPWLFLPSTDWAQGGPILDHLIDSGWNIAKADFGLGVRLFRFVDDSIEYNYGPTPLIAVMRCLVASKLGDEVEVPDELA